MSEWPENEMVSDCERVHPLVMNWFENAEISGERLEQVCRPAVIQAMSCLITEFIMEEIESSPLKSIPVAKEALEDALALKLTRWLGITTLLLHDAEHSEFFLDL